MTKEELEELKKDPIKFIKLFTNVEIQPYQEALLELMLRNPKANLITCDYRRQGKVWRRQIQEQKHLLLMKEKEVYTIVTVKGQATFLCIENTTGIK